MFNKVVLVGNLTRDIELRYFQGGGCVAIIGLAVNRKYKKQDGSQGEEVCFIDCKVYGRIAEVANQYLKKGSKLLIEGRITQESWVDNGAKRSKHVIHGETIQMLDNKPQTQNQDTQAQYYQESYHNAPSVDMSIADEDVPF